MLRYPKGATGDPLPALSRTDDGVDILEGSADAPADVLFVVVGPMSRVALEAAEILARQGIVTLGQARAAAGRSQFARLKY